MAQVEQVSRRAVDVAQPARAKPRHRVEPTRGWPGFGLRELWHVRELLAFLVWRDLKVRYKQTLLGASWAISRPFITMVVFSAIFGGIAGIRSGTGIPYPLFVFAGLLPWMYFATALGSASGSVLGNANLLTKAYFPRIILPLSAALIPVVDLAFALLVFAGMFAWFGRVPSWQAVLMPCFIGLAFLASFGTALWLSALTVRFRDVPFLIPFAIQAWMYTTPVIYPVTLVPSHWRWLLRVNPMTGAVSGFRWSVFGSGAPDYVLYGISAAVGGALTLAGWLYFRRAESRFADII